MVHEIGKDTDGTCAGRPIRGAMYPFSGDLIRGCERLSVMAEQAVDLLDVRLHNTSCVLFAVSAIDARVNEWIAIAREIEDAKIPVAFWQQLSDLVKSLRLEEKWNLIASVSKGSLWDGGREPFQSYGIIVALRNELIHFKGQLLGKDEAPNKKIKTLIGQLGIKSDASFIESDASSWVYDILMYRGLGSWVYRRVKPFYDEVLSLLLRVP